MNGNVEETAARIAERGRDTLLARLRPAFKEAASAHADVLSLDEEQLEQMVQRAADRADGLQWRRALATVATEELGIGLGEALSHPAVARAQELVGAPSYEESLARLNEGAPLTGASTGGSGAGGGATAAPELVEAAPAPAPEDELPVEEEEAEPEPDLGPEPDDEPLAPEELAEAEAPEVEEADLPQPHGDELGTEAEATHVEEAEGLAAQDEFEDELEDELEPGEPAEPQILRLMAVHLGGIATLETPEQGLELRLGDFGLDIARKPGRVIGRLRWPEIKALEVAPPRGLRRRRRQGQTHLLVRTPHGDASFEVPAVTEDELREHLEPLISRYSAG